jgi:hypothetical protein
LLEVWERLPLSCRTSTTGPVGGSVGESKSAHHKHLETLTAGPLGGADEESGSAYHHR